MILKNNRSEKAPRIREPKNVRTERFRTALFLVPSLAGVLLFFILPFFVVIFYAFVDNPINRDFVGVDNFVRLFQNSAFRTAVKNTLSFSLISVPAAVVLSLLLAILLCEKLPGVSLFRSLFITPQMVPVASVVLIWQVIFHFNGSLNEILALFGAQPIDWLKSEYSQVIAVMLYLWKNIGYNMILFMAALSNIPVDILEVATLEGCGAWRKFWHIKLRYLSSSILFVAILSLINSFKVFREVYLLTGDYPFDSLYLLQHFMNNTFRSLDYQKLSSAALVMCVVMVLIIGVLFYVDRRIGGDIEE